LAKPVSSASGRPFGGRGIGERRGYLRSWFVPRERHNIQLGGERPFTGTIHHKKRQRQGWDIANQMPIVGWKKKKTRLEEALVALESTLSYIRHKNVEEGREGENYAHAKE